MIRRFSSRSSRSQAAPMSSACMSRRTSASGTGGELEERWLELSELLD